MDNVPAQAMAGAGADSGSGNEAAMTPASTDTRTDSHPLMAGFGKLNIVRQAAVIGGIALVIALVVAIFIWSREPTYKPLIHRMQDHNAQDIVEVLQREDIPFQIDPVTQILMVQASDLHEARMKLAAASLIDDKTVGLEVLEKDRTFSYEEC